MKQLLQNKEKIELVNCLLTWPYDKSNISINNYMEKTNSIN